MSGKFIGSYQSLRTAGFPAWGCFLTSCSGFLAFIGQPPCGCRLNGTWPAPCWGNRSGLPDRRGFPRCVLPSGVPGGSCPSSLLPTTCLSWSSCLLRYPAFLLRFDLNLADSGLEKNRRGSEIGIRQLWTARSDVGSAAHRRLSDGAPKRPPGGIARASRRLPTPPRGAPGNGPGGRGRLAKHLTTGPDRITRFDNEEGFSERRPWPVSSPGNS